MDFTPELSAFQGLIVSANHSHNFSRITSRGGKKHLTYVNSFFVRITVRAGFSTFN